MRAPLSDREFDAARVAERKLSSRFDQPSSHIVAASCRLWGRTFSEERDARLIDCGESMRTKQAKRGHISRAMIKELEAEFATGGST